MSVVRLRNVRALLDPSIKALFVRAFANEHVHVDIEKAWPDIENMVRNDKRFGVWLGEENAKWVGLVIVALPESLLFPYPDFVNLYCEGSHETAKTLGLTAVDFLKSAGYNTAWAVNASGRPDPVWLRVMRPAGEWRNIGNLMECHLK